jgi:hypothetical protein
MTRRLAAKFRQSESGACYAFPYGRWSACSTRRADANRREAAALTPLIDLDGLSRCPAKERGQCKVYRGRPQRRDRHLCLMGAGRYVCANMSETKSVAVATRNDAYIAFRKLASSVGMDAGLFLLGLFGAKVSAELPDRQLSEFVRLCELGMQSNTLEELKQSIRADAGPPEPTYEDVVDAAATLRKRINEDAVRWLSRRFGHNETSRLRHYRDSGLFRKFIRLSRLEASTAEEFALALADTYDNNWSREARAPLPDDLQVLALEYRCKEDLAVDIDLSDVWNQIGCF